MTRLVCALIHAAASRAWGEVTEPNQRAALERYWASGDAVMAYWVASGAR